MPNALLALPNSVKALHKNMTWNSSFFDGTQIGRMGTDLR
jgi:hypothetical protein